MAKPGKGGSVPLQERGIRGKRTNKENQYEKKGSSAVTVKALKPIRGGGHLI